MVHAYQQGKLKHPSEEVRRIAKGISKTDAKHFAATKHEGLPESKTADAPLDLPYTPQMQEAGGIDASGNPIARAQSPTGMQGIPSLGLRGVASLGRILNSFIVQPEIQPARDMISNAWRSGTAFKDMRLLQGSQESMQDELSNFNLTTPKHEAIASDLYWRHKNQLDRDIAGRRLEFMRSGGFALGNTALTVANEWTLGRAAPATAAAAAAEGAGKGALACLAGRLVDISVNPRFIKPLQKVMAPVGGGVWGVTKGLAQKIIPAGVLGMEGGFGGMAIKNEVAPFFAKDEVAPFSAQSEPADASLLNFNPPQDVSDLNSKAPFSLQSTAHMHPIADIPASSAPAPSPAAPGSPSLPNAPLGLTPNKLLLGGAIGAAGLGLYGLGRYLQNRADRKRQEMAQKQTQTPLGFQPKLAKLASYIQRTGTGSYVVGDPIINKLPSFFDTDASYAELYSRAFWRSLR